MSAIRPRKILLTTDFSEGAAEAYPYAVALARKYRSELILLHVITFYSEYLDPAHYAFLQASYLEAVQNVRREELDEIDLAEETDFEVRRELISASSVPAGIVSFIDQESPDLVVMSTHGRRPVAQLILGSVARRLVAADKAPVFAVKHRRPGVFLDAAGKLSVRKILVPTDMSEPSRRAYQLALDLAREHSALVELLYVFSYELPVISDGLATFVHLDEDTRAQGRQKLQAFRDSLPHEEIEVHSVLDDGPAAKRIAEHARSNDFDLIVVSRLGLHGSRHAIGGVAERLLHDSDRPLIVV